ncbi:hypothetical protein FBU30_004482 [Linnemannia zychae]|nr:hypothetical protein FBU30_004482 [Linnemannia zychae]
MLTEKNMLTTPARPTSLSRNQSFESPPCPPYNQEDILSHAPPASEDDELWAELERIKDARALREKFYAEHQLMREQLNMAGRFGLDLQQSLEQAQRAEQEYYSQIQSLQEENIMLQSRAQHSRELANHLTGSQDEVLVLTNEKDTLQRELDGCRRELKMFRKELDGLVEQMTEMGTEVLDAKAKVSHYSRRLNEVEQELGATQELNVNLQEQLNFAVEKQKQAQSSTAQAVKNMQSELGKVLLDKSTILTTLEELENRQEKCEGRVVEIMSNTQEYAQLLEEAQTTIQTLRIESEMEGRGWTHRSPSIQNSTSQLSTLASEDPELCQPEFDVRTETQDENNTEQVVMSLGMELGMGSTQHDEDNDDQIVSSPTELEPISKALVDKTPTPPTPAPTSCPTTTASSTKHPTPAISPLPPAITPQKKKKTAAETQSQLHAQSLRVSPVPLQSPVSEIQHRQEEHSIPQTVQTTGQSRPPWNPSVSLENPILGSGQGRSRSTSRATSRSSSRSVSQVSSRHVGPSSPSTTIRNNNSIHSRTSAMPSPQISPHSFSAATSASSFTDTISAHSGKRNNVSTTSSSNNNSNKAPSQNRVRSRTTATTVEKSHVEKNATPGPKLATKGGDANDTLNIITKSKTTSKPNKPSTSPSSGPGGRTRAISASVASTTSQNTLKSGRLHPIIDASSSAVQTGRSSPASPRQRIQSSISNNSLNRQALSSSSPSLHGSPASSTATHFTQATTSLSVSRSTASSPKDSSRRPSLSPSPYALSSSQTSPLSSSPSDASKQLKAMAEESSGGTGSRRPSVTSMPLPLPVPPASTVVVSEIMLAPIAATTADLVA